MPSNRPTSALTDAAKDGVADLVENYVRAGLDDFRYAVTDLPGFLADDSPVVAAGLPTKLILRAACRSYARGGGPQNLPGFDGAWGAICEPYLESIGENPGDGAFSPPFTGGQCDGVCYRVSVVSDVATGGSFTTRGPIGGVRGVFLDSGGRLEVLSRSAARQGSTQTTCDPLSTYTWRSTGFGGTVWRPENNPRITSVVRLGTGSDNCGNPPNGYDPPNIPPNLPTVPPTPIRFPGIGPTPVTVNFNADGTLVVNLPDINLSVPISDPFGFSGDPSTPGGSDPPPGDVGQEGTSQGADSDGDAEGEAPPGSVLTGLRVQISTAPASATRYSNDVYRGAYYVYMGVPGKLDHDPAGSMALQDQFVFAEKDNLTSWRVRANKGYGLIVTPYYRQVT